MRSVRLKWWFIPTGLVLVLLAYVLLEVAPGDEGTKNDALGKTATASGPEVKIVSTYSGSLTSHPSDHHKVENNRDPSGELADWAEDWGLPAGTEIRPQLEGPYGTELYVADVVEACRGGGGGSSVKIGVRAPNGGEEIGWVAYVHLSDVAVSKGQKVYANTVLGKIGDGFPVNENCWTGPHLHLEAFNVHQYACYVDFAVGHRVEPGTVVGRVGGSDVGGAPQPCP